MFHFIKKYFDGRKILICREITKYYEEFYRSEVKYLNIPDNDLKGEITVVISEKNKLKKVQKIYPNLIKFL